MHHSHRTWFPYILIGLTLALLLVVFAITGQEEREVIPALQEPEYIEAVSSILQDYAAGDDAYTTYQSLLEIRIQEEQKELHLELVLLFGKLLTGEIDNVDAHLEELDREHSWIIE